MNKKTNLKLPSGIIILFLFFFGFLNTAFAGELSIRAKSIASDILGKAGCTSASNYLKTDLGISSRVNNLINNPGGALRGSVNSITGMRSLIGNVGSPISALGINASAITGKLSNLSTYIGRASGLWGAKPQENKFNGAFIYMKMVTQTITTKTPADKSEMDPTNLSDIIDKSIGLQSAKSQEANIVKTNQSLPNAAIIMTSMISTKTEVPVNKSEKNLLNTNQSSGIFQNLSLLSDALKKVGTNFSHVTAIKGDIYHPNGSLAQKNVVIVDQNQIKNGLNNSKLSGKIIDVTSIQSQKSY